MSLIKQKNTGSSLIDYRYQTGFSLMEVLVALIILSVGLLGVANMQMLGLTFNQNAYYRSQANLLASDIIERMRQNPQGIDAGNYSNGTANNSTFTMTFNIDGTISPALTDPDCISNTCSSAQLATYDLIQWQNAINAALPKEVDADDASLTTGEVKLISGNLYTISINWGVKEQGSGGQLFNDVYQSRTISFNVQI